MIFRALVLAGMMVSLGTITQAQQSQTLSPATQGPSFDETLAFIRETLTRYPARNVDYNRFDVVSNTVFIDNTIYTSGSAYYMSKFSISHISKISLDTSDNAIKIVLSCKNADKCIDVVVQNPRNSYNTNQKNMHVNDKNKAEKLVIAMKHLFSLRGWQETKDPF